jgi:hypothetical protein
MSEADLALLQRAAEHTASAALIAAQLAGLEPDALEAAACSQALNDWRPPDGWHW